MPAQHLEGHCLWCVHETEGSVLGIRFFSVCADLNVCRNFSESTLVCITPCSLKSLTATSQLSPHLQCNCLLLCDSPLVISVTIRKMEVPGTEDSGSERHGLIGQRSLSGDGIHCLTSQVFPFIPQIVISLAGAQFTFLNPKFQTLVLPCRQHVPLLTALPFLDLSP